MRLLFLRHKIKGWLCTCWYHWAIAASAQKWRSNAVKMHIRYDIKFTFSIRYWPCQCHTGHDSSCEFCRLYHRMQIPEASNFRETSPLSIFPNDARLLLRWGKRAYVFWCIIAGIRRPYILLLCMMLLSASASQSVINAHCTRVKTVKSKLPSHFHNCRF
jgi:hypothetical protein